MRIELLPRPPRRIQMLVIWAVGAGLALTPAQGQSFPEKPIRMIVPSPPGGGTDTVSRLIATKLGEALKWQIFVENRPGAGGNIGMDIVAKAAADGYTLAMGESSNLTINPYLYAKMPFDPAKDLAPVTLVGTVPLVLVAAPAKGFSDIAQLSAEAKTKTLAFASGGNGTVGHLAGELWMRQAGVKLRHVPYRGGAQAITDVVGNQVDMTFASIPAAASLIEAGSLKALAVTGTARSAQLPNVRTFDELGFKGFSAQVLYGIVAPKGTPQPVIDRLNAEINAALKSPDVRAGLAKVGITTQAGSAGDFDAFLATERSKWSKAVAESGARVD